MQDSEAFMLKIMETKPVTLALDNLLDYVDDLLTSNPVFDENGAVRFVASPTIKEEVNAILAATTKYLHKGWAGDPPTSILLGVLAITYPFKHEVLEEWSNLSQKLYQKMLTEKGKDKADELMQGLI